MAEQDPISAGIIAQAQREIDDLHAKIERVQALVDGLHDDREAVGLSNLIRDILDG